MFKRVILKHETNLAPGKVRAHFSWNVGSKSQIGCCLFCLC